MTRSAHSAALEPLPELLDARRLQGELGVTRAAAETIMRQLPVVTFPELRKVYVKRCDLARLLEARTSAGHWKFDKTGAPA